ncbi:MAG TPA: hypothetical protein VIN08_28355 [Ohtaekwangia sp.]|uniref:hypothetical protein n=1 Tax=Ohtaekwangia sp. TaxID=2066019 RepID=UPI002F945652
MKKQAFKYFGLIFLVLMVFHILKFVNRREEFHFEGTKDFFYKLYMTLRWSAPIYLLLAAIGGIIIAIVLQKREQKGDKKESDKKQKSKKK